MVKYNCIIREDNTGKTLSEEAMLDAVDIEETLKTKYSYIYNSMMKTNYKLKINHCTYFKEIVFKKKVVGFIAYTIINSVTNLSMVASYILPEYRKKGLFFDEINKKFEQSNEISIYQPPRFVIELLIKYGFAKKINNNLIVTSINIDIPSNKISNIYGMDKLLYEDYTYTSNLYDINLCGFLIRPNEEKAIYLSSSYPEDEKRYSCEKEREKLTDEYFKKINDTITKKEDDINNFIINIKKTYSLDFEEKDKQEYNIDFKKFTKTNNENQIDEDIIEIYDKLEKNKHSLFEDESSFNKMKYIQSFQNVEIYDFIRIFNENNNLELTNSIIKIDYGFKSNYIKNIILKEGYISDNVNIEEEKKYLKSLKVNELKDILKNNHLPVSGNKSELINRIIEYVPSNMILENNYKTTEKGYEFIEEHEEIEFYNSFLKNFHYYEFNEFNKNHEGTLYEISELFLEEHLKASTIRWDYTAYTDSLNSLSYINKKNNNIKKSLYYELKKFIVGLNPVFLDESSYNYYQPVSENNIENLKKLLEIKNFNLDEEFKYAWQNMEQKEFPVHFEKSLNILHKMISGEDRDYMNDKIREEYLTKKTIIHDKLDKSVQSTLDKYLE